MTKKKEKEYTINERVFLNENSKSLEDLLNVYFNNKIDEIIKENYNKEETRAISEREVA